MAHLRTGLPQPDAGHNPAAIDDTRRLAIVHGSDVLIPVSVLSDNTGIDHCLVLRP